MITMVCNHGSLKNDCLAKEEVFRDPFLLALVVILYDCSATINEISFSSYQLSTYNNDNDYFCIPYFSKNPIVAHSVSPILTSVPH